MILGVGERGGNCGGIGRKGQEWEGRAEGGFLSGGEKGLDKMGVKRRPSDATANLEKNELVIFPSGTTANLEKNELVIFPQALQRIWKRTNW